MNGEMLTKKTYFFDCSLSPPVTAFFKFFEKYDLKFFTGMIDTNMVELLFQSFEELRRSGRQEIATKWQAYILEIGFIPIIASRVEEEENSMILILTVEAYECISALRDADEGIFGGLVNLFPHTLISVFLKRLKDSGDDELFEKWKSHLIDNDKDCASMLGEIEI